MPFLTVLAEPEKIYTLDIFSWFYVSGQFSGEYAFLVALGLFSVFVILVSSLLQIFRVWAISNFTFGLISSISEKLLASYLTRPYEYFVNNHSGDLSTQMLSESQEAVNQFFRPICEFISATMTSLAIIALLIWLEPAVAIFAIILFGSFYISTYVISRKMVKRAGTVRANANKDRFRFANETLAGIKDTKMLGLERIYLGRFRNAAHRMSRALVTIQVAGEIPQFAMQAIGFGGIILLCLILLDPVALGTPSGLTQILPTIGVFAFAGQRLLPEISRIYYSVTKFNAGSVVINSISADLADTKNEPFRKFEEQAPLRLQKQLSIENLYFSYQDSDQINIANFSVKINAGEKIGIVGSTGSGKTTLVDLILGLLTPTSGRIVVDDILINNYTLGAWRKALGYVPQDIFLADASIAENIALGIAHNDIDYSRLVSAVKLAQLDKFIECDLPDGFHTNVGERGMRLSGGQRQRIGIARALYYEADLIVFDEATSALDNRTERGVISSIDNLPRCKTIIIVAHRMSTVKSCDRIIALENGKLVGFGSWEELSNSNIQFNKMLDDHSKENTP